MNRSVVIHHSSAWWRSQRATSRWTAGSVPRCRSGRGGKRVAWATPSGMVLSLPQLLPQQKAVGQHGADGMPVETRPPPPLVLVPTPFPLGLFMELLHRVAAMGHVHQLLQGGRGRQIAPVVLTLLRLSASGPLAQQPADAGLSWRRQAPPTQRQKLFTPPALAPLAPADGAPLGCRSFCWATR
jgi:hypothetical protein